MQHWLTGDHFRLNLLQHLNSYWFLPMKCTARLEPMAYLKRKRHTIRHRHILPQKLPLTTLLSLGIGRMDYQL